MAYQEEKISQFKSGDSVIGFFYIKESEMKTTTTGNKYMNFTISDSSGDINAKFWDSAPENETLFKSGIIVKIAGSVTTFNNALQFKVEKIRRSQDTDNLSISDFIPSAPDSGEEMYKYIESVIAEMKDRELADFVLHVIEKYKDKLLHFPGAKSMHHAMRDGLLYHTTSMLKSGVAICDIYEFLDKDLLCAGVILHDIGKIFEMETSDVGLVTDYTADGKLLGHIIEGITVIKEEAKKTNFNEEKSMVLQHMILSHHYEPEYGSPKYPMFPEAELLHYLDIMDARLFSIGKIEDGLEPGEFSERIKSLDGRQIYKPTWN